MESTQPAIVLLSGGLDSATVLAIAASEGFACHCLTFDYGQRHRFELESARKVATASGALSHRVLTLDPRPMASSALTGGGEVPKGGESAGGGGIPSTYVPARNLIFLSMAIGVAECEGARDIFLGVNAIDYSGYPDCRPEFVAAFETAANLATKAGVEGDGFRIRSPLIELTKAEIIALGTSLGVDYGLTHSCYDPAGDGGACGRCDACRLRRKGFEEAGIADPTRYTS